MNLGFWGAPASPGFVPAERTDSRPIKIGGQDRTPFLGRQAAHAGVGGRRRGGPIRQPSRWLSGSGPKRRRPSRPRAGFSHMGRLHSYDFNCFFYFSEAFS